MTRAPGAGSKTAAGPTLGLAADVGLVRALSAWELAAAIANVIVGSGIFVLPAAMASAAGPAAALYYVACAGMIGAVGLCFAEAGSRVAISGGIAGCVEVALGRYAGFLTAVMLWLAAALAAAGIATAIAEMLGRALPAFREPAWRAAFIVVLLSTLAVVNISGVRAGGRLVTLAILLKVTPLVLLVVLGAVGGADAAPAGPAAGRADIGRAMLLGVFAFMGMETALGVSGEVRQPERSVPFAIFVSLAAVTVLYVSLQLVAQVLLGSDLTGSKAPLVEAAGRISPVLAAVVAAGAAISMIGYLASNVLAAPRMLFGMARDGLLPRGVAGVRSASHAPVAAIALHAGLVMVLAITGAFAQLVVLATLVTLVAYALGCVSAYLLQRRRVALQGRPLNARLTPAAAGLGLIAIVWVALQGTWTEAGAVFAAALLASVYFVLWTRTHRPPTVRG